MLRLAAGLTDLVGDPELLVVTVVEVTVLRLTTGLDSGLLCACRQKQLIDVKFIQNQEGLM